LFDASLSANTPTIGTGIWTGSGSGLISNASLNNTIVTNLDEGINTFTWSISNGACAPSSDQVIIVAYQKPTIANAGADQEVCLFDASLAANTPTTGTGLWTTTGNGTIANESLNNTSVSNLDIGVNSFTWTITNGACASSSDQLMITSYQNPTKADAGKDSAVCATNTTLTANMPTIGKGNWSTTGNAIFSTENSSSTSVSNLDSGVNTFTWTISNGACLPSSDQMIITSNKIPDLNLQVLGDLVCSGNNAMATIFSSQDNIDYESFIGTKSVGLGTGNGSDLNITIQSTDLVLGKNMIHFTATNPSTGCSDKLDNMSTITVNNNPTTNLIVNGSTVCQGDEGTVSILASEKAANYEAFIGNQVVATAVGNGGNIDISINNNYLMTGDNQIKFTTNLLNCSEELLNQANVHVNENPISKLEVSSTEVCYGKKTIFTIYGSENGIEYELFTNGQSLTIANGDGSDLPIEIPSTSLIIGGNFINVVARNNSTTCQVPLENEGQILYKYCDIMVYDGFSPNKDGINETFIIEGLERYPKHKVMIFNRWGNKVYEASPYLNDWDGTNIFGITVGGKELPVGTYFYIIDPGNGEQVIKGYLYLNR
jgi:gliding motility-associated-like protein